MIEELDNELAFPDPFAPCYCCAPYIHKPGDTVVFQDTLITLTECVWQTFFMERWKYEVIK